MAEEIPRKVQVLELQKLCDLDLGSGRGHTGPHIWSRSTHKIKSKSEKTLFADVWTDSEFHSIRSSRGDDLKIS